MGETVTSEQVFKDTYYSPPNPVAFGGREPFLKSLPKRSREDAKRWLRGQEAYSIHKPARKTFKRRRTVVSAPQEQVQADLMDVSKLASENAGNRFMLTATDTFSRKSAVEPIVSKHASVVADALQRVYEKLPFRRLQTDKGKEFLNSKVAEFCKRHDITHFTSDNTETKASIVERFNKTLRLKIYRYLTAEDTTSYIDALPALVDGYNASIHSSTGFAPDAVSTDDVEDIYHRLYEERGVPDWVKRPPSDPISPGDFVRTSRARETFSRGYTPNWSVEAFVVTEMLPGVFPRVYRLKDLADESINGTFYEKELQKIPEPSVFRIDKVIKRKTIRGKRQLFVKWLGYPDKFNEWISEEQVV